MGKNNKKRKTTHQTHNASNGPSHDEIWDDSALIRSWNQAVEEYEYYHSIHARGEDVDEILRKAEEAEQQLESHVDRSGVEVNGDAKGVEEGELDDSDVADDEDVITDQVAAATDGKSAAPLAAPLPTVEPLPVGYEAQQSAVAPVVAAGVGADQTLENIKMAYYWAGYYSGLYDGQRQAQTAEQVSSQMQKQSNDNG